MVDADYGAKGELFIRYEPNTKLLWFHKNVQRLLRRAPNQLQRILRELKES